jgi:Domain of unknown function (DUF1843).
LGLWIKKEQILITKNKIMGVIMPYGAAIREALVSNDLTKMEAIAEQAKETIKQQGDLTAAYLELIEAIEALKNKK